MMRDSHSPYCPHCGRNMIFDDTVCPYCGETVRSPRRRKTPSPVRKQSGSRQCETASAGNRSGADRRSRQSGSLNGSAKWVAIIVALLVLSGPILSFVGVIFGTVGEIIDELWYSYSSGSSEAVEVEVPEETWPEPEYYTLPQEEYDLLVEGVIWEDEEQWNALYESLSREEKKAMDAIRLDLRWGTVSHTQAMQIITEEGCSEEVAEQTLERLNIDWDIQALRSVLSYLRHGAYTPADLQRQLEYEGFTQEQIDFAIESCGADWDYQLELIMEDVLQYGGYSEAGLVGYLENKGASRDQAEELVAGCDADWYDQAVRCAQDYIEYVDMDREELQYQLGYEQFTEDQIQFALDFLEVD